ncbi:outer membrane protein [Tropicimonas marinistellae]|uniref:outer membrane protein n=1 Tax=Tropicimonas marinistellae TaxID=1739787 RepID=UPI001372D6A2|nr:outer membrane beta-barrel protein [Tropicimonas marinistellae]
MLTTDAEAAPVAAVVASQFAGGYAGISLGYAFGGDDDVGVRGGGLSGTETIGSLEAGGTLGGLQLGYRWDLDPVLIGLEIGVTGGDLSDSFDNSDGAAETELQHEVSLRGSLGWELNAETLLYGFVGVSQAEFDYEVSGPDGADIDESFSPTGYLAGLGAEWALGENWSLRGEYRYTNYGKETLSDNAGHKTEATPKFHLVSLGLNYRF